jgi:hypothetical protein
MSSPFDRLLMAQTDTELFVILCDLTHTSRRIGSNLKADLVSCRVGKEYMLKLTIQQAMAYCVTSELAAQYHDVPPLGSQLLRWEVVHEFILPANAPLVWKMRNQIEAVGCYDIQQHLEQLRDWISLPSSLQG